MAKFILCLVATAVSLAYIAQRGVEMDNKVESRGIRRRLTEATSSSGQVSEQHLKRAKKKLDKKNKRKNPDKDKNSNNNGNKRQNRNRNNRNGNNRNDGGYYNYPPPPMNWGPPPVDWQQGPPPNYWQQGPTPPGLWHEEPPQDDYNPWLPAPAPVPAEKIDNKEEEEARPPSRIEDWEKPPPREEEPPTWETPPPRPDISLATHSITEHDKWRLNEGDTGLSLKVYNNLPRGSIWKSYLEDAFYNWDNRYELPSSMAITYEPIPESSEVHECPPLPFSITVCNDNYGESKWKGVTHTYLKEDGTIVSATIKLNDYYVDDMDGEEMLYTCCHELGHGLGLRHWDSSFKNDDMYNCMDYTNKHENNMFPSLGTFTALRSMYGNRRRKLRPDDQTVAPNKIDQLSAEELKTYFKGFIDDEEDYSGWKVIRQHHRGEVREKVFENGAKVHAQFLLA